MVRIGRRGSYADVAMVKTLLNAVIAKCLVTLHEIEVRLCHLEYESGDDSDVLLLKLQWAEVAEFIRATKMEAAR